MTTPSARAVLLTLALAGLGLRLAWPLADPPQAVSWSSGIWTDPPANTLPARWAIESDDPQVLIAERLVYPLLNAVAWGFWMLVGANRLSSVLLAVLLGASSLGVGDKHARTSPTRPALL